MRKIILALVFVLAMASQAWAGPALVVNGERQPVETITKDGVTYVPIRVVSEELGAEVGYDAASNTVSISKPVLSRPIITGDEEFVKIVNEALDLLQWHDLPHYTMICMNVREIKHSKEYMLGERRYTARQQGDTIYLSDLLKSKDYTVDLYNPISIAGEIVHEGAHAANYHNRIGSFVNDEKLAYEHQIAALYILGAPQDLIDFTIKLEKLYAN